MVETTEIEAPASVFRTYRDALGVLRRTYREYNDPQISRKAATELRHKLSNTTNGWADGLHSVELTDREIDLLWSGISDIIFDNDSRRARKRAHRAADHLVFSEADAPAEAQ